MKSNRSIQRLAVAAGSAVLVGVFALQPLGSGYIGRLFGPIDEPLGNRWLA